jgi:hypothetical protein
MSELRSRMAVDRQARTLPDPPISKTQRGEIMTENMTEIINTNTLWIMAVSTAIILFAAFYIENEWSLGDLDLIARIITAFGLIASVIFALLSGLMLSIFMFRESVRINENGDILFFFLPIILLFSCLMLIMSVSKQIGHDKGVQIGRDDKRDQELKDEVAKRLKDTDGIRAEILFLAVEMEKKLAEHPDRPGWRGESNDYLFNRLLIELAELQEAIAFGPEIEIIRESADVANFAMMLADNARQELLDIGVETNDD